MMIKNSRLPVAAPLSFHLIPRIHRRPGVLLSIAFSELKSSIDHTETTLHSLQTPVASPISGTFIPCPLYANHRVPPSSLFSHYLNCPSPLSLPHTFHYQQSTYPPTASSDLPPESSSNARFEERRTVCELFNSSTGAPLMQHYVGLRPMFDLEVVKEDARLVLGEPGS